MLGTYPLGPCDVNGTCLSDGHTSGIQPQRIRESLGCWAFVKLSRVSDMWLIYRGYVSRTYDTRIPNMIEWNRESHVS